MAVPDIGSIDYVKYTNVTRCFQIILKAAETSRTRIAEISRISKVTVSSCVDFLLDKKLICEVGFQESRRGRKPTLITVIPMPGFCSASRRTLSAANISSQILLGNCWKRDRSPAR